MVKECDTEEARDREAAWLRQLRCRRCWTRGRRCRGRTRRTAARTRSPSSGPAGPTPAGRSWRPARRGLPEEALAQLRAALGAMHRLGGAHGDTREPNFARDPAAGRAFVLDLGSALGRDEEARPWAECRAGRARLDEVAAGARARRPPAGS